MDVLLFFVSVPDLLLQSGPRINDNMFNSHPFKILTECFSIQFSTFLSKVFSFQSP